MLCYFFLKKFSIVLLILVLIFINTSLQEKTNARSKVLYWHVMLRSVPMALFWKSIRRCKDHSFISYVTYTPHDVTNTPMSFILPMPSLILP